MSGVADPVILSGEAMDEEQLMKSSVDTANTLLEYVIYLNVAFLSFIFGDFDRAAMYSQKIWDIADKFPGMYIINIQAFYDGLSSYALARRITKNKKKWRKRGRKMTNKFVTWAKKCPSNNAHKALLLKAEDAALFAVKSKKKRELANNAYAAAISTAKNSGFLNDAAIASERAAEFYNDIGEEEIFATHIAQLYRLYHKWGATAKCEGIANTYPEIVFNTIE